MFRAAVNLIKWCAFLVLATTVVMFLGFHFRQDIADELGDYLLEPGVEETSDIIFILGGEPATRLTYGLDLFEKGLSSQLWYSATAESENDRAFKARFGFSPGEEFVVESALTKRGLPERTWRILPGSSSTWSDFLHLKDALGERADSGNLSILVVSSPYHFRRVSFCIRRLFGQDSTITFRYAYPAPDEWKARLKDRDDIPLLILTEYVKLLGYKLKYYRESL